MDLTAWKASARCTRAGPAGATGPGSCHRQSRACSCAPRIPKTALPVRVLVRLEERESETWDPDMVPALDELVFLNDLGRNLISLRVT
jgi:hypothetical protein